MAAGAGGPRRRRARGRTTPMDPWHLAYTTDVRAVASRSTARSCSRDGLRPGSTPVEVRAKAAEQAGAPPPAADEPTDGRTASRCTSRTPTRSARRWTTCGTRRSAGSRPCGRPRAGSCARRPCRWPRSPRSPSASRSARGVVAMWTRNPALLAATFSTLDDLAPGRVILGIGAWWDPLAREGRRRSRDGRCKAMREIVDGRARRCSRTRPSPSTASSCTSTASSSTTCTRSAGPRTCRSTSAPPACR